MTLNGYKFEFSPKFALLNFKHIRQMAAQVRLLSQICLVDFLTHSLGGARVTLASAGLSCLHCDRTVNIPTLCATRMVTSFRGSVFSSPTDAGDYRTVAESTKTVDGRKIVTNR